MPPAKRTRVLPPAPSDKYASTVYPSQLHEGKTCTAAEAIYFRARDLLEKHGDDSLEREVCQQWERLHLVEKHHCKQRRNPLALWSVGELYAFTEWSKLTETAQEAAMLRATISRIDSATTLKGKVAAINNLYRANHAAVSDFQLGGVVDYISEDNLFNFFLIDGGKYARRSEVEPNARCELQRGFCSDARLSGCLEAVSAPVSTSTAPPSARWLHPCYGEEEPSIYCEDNCWNHYLARTPATVTSDKWGGRVCRVLRVHGRRIFESDGARCAPPLTEWAFRLPLSLKPKPLPGAARICEMQARSVAWQARSSAGAIAWATDPDLLVCILEHCGPTAQRRSRLVCRFWAAVFDTGAIPYCPRLDFHDGPACLLGTAHLAPLLRTLDLSLLGGDAGEMRCWSHVCSLVRSLSALSTLRIASNAFGSTSPLLSVLRAAPRLRSLQIFVHMAREHPSLPGGSGAAKADQMQVDDHFLAELATSCPDLRSLQLPLLTHEPTASPPRARKRLVTDAGVRSLATLCNLHELRIDADTKPDRTGGAICGCRHSECSADKHVQINRPLALLDIGQEAWALLFTQTALQRLLIFEIIPHEASPPRVLPRMSPLRGLPALESLWTQHSQVANGEDPFPALEKQLHAAAAAAQGRTARGASPQIFLSRAEALYHQCEGALTRQCSRFGREVLSYSALRTAVQQRALVRHTVELVRGTAQNAYHMVAF